MDQQPPLPTSNSMLPKLIKDKINDYKIINQINSAVDEYFIQIKNQLELINRKLSNNTIKICDGYNYVEGKKIHCSKLGTYDEMRAKESEVICCENPYHFNYTPNIESYCKEHSKYKLYRIKIGTINPRRRIYCNDCIENEQITNFKNL